MKLKDKGNERKFDFYQKAWEYKGKLEDLISHLSDEKQTFDKWFLAEHPLRWLIDLLGLERIYYHDLLCLPTLNGKVIKDDHTGDYYGLLSSDNVYTKTEVDNKVNSKVDKININYSIYATDNIGQQTRLPYSSIATNWSIAHRNGHGALAVGEPQADNEATPKSYVDDAYQTEHQERVQGDELLQTQIDNLKGFGTFVTGWNCSTGQQDSDPYPSGHTFQRGDYYIVHTVAAEGGTNYKPTSVYGETSTIVETDEVKPGDFYVWAGTESNPNWIHFESKEAIVIWEEIYGDPYSNNNLKAKFDTKQDANVLQSFVGMIIMGNSNVSTLEQVKALYGSDTNWEKIEGKFLYATDTTHAVGTEGGNNDAIVVEHTHIATCSEAGSHEHTLSGSTSENGSHTHDTHRPVQFGMNAATTYGWCSGDSRTADDWYATSNANGAHVHNLNGENAKAESNGAHTHIVTNANTGIAGTEKNMPAYLAVNMWIRTE